MGVWVGGRRRFLNRLTGAQGAAPLWAKLMMMLHQNHPGDTFKKDLIQSGNRFGTWKEVSSSPSNASSNTSSESSSKSLSTSLADSANTQGLSTSLSKADFQWISPIDQMHFSLSPHHRSDQQKIFAQIKASSHLKRMYWRLNKNPQNVMERTAYHRHFEFWIRPPHGENRLCAWTDSLPLKCIDFIVTYPAHLQPKFP